MKNKYKIIAIDRDRHDPVRELEREVNEFIMKNAGFVPTTAPAVLDNDIVQMLIHVSAVENGY